MAPPGQDTFSCHVINPEKNLHEIHMLKRTVSVYKIYFFLMAMVLGVALYIGYELMVHDVYQDPLTTEQRRWLTAHDGKIRMAPIPYWEPMEIFDENGNYSGLVAEFIKLLEKKLKFKLNLVHENSWEEILNKAQAGEIDVLSAAKSTPERDLYLVWTEPYLDIPNVIITRKSYKGELTLEDLADKRVGMMGKYVITEYVESTYKEIKIVKLKNDLDGLMRVSLGDLDAVIVEFPYASYAIGREKITNLRIAGEVKYRSLQSIGIRKDWPILRDILGKGLSMITTAERKEILGKWMYLMDTPFYQKKQFWYIFAASVVTSIFIAGIVTIWNLSLQKKVNEKTREIVNQLAEKEKISSKLLKSQQRLSTLIGNFPGMAYRHYFSESDPEWPMEYISPGGYELTGYKTLCGPGLENFFFNVVVHPEDGIYNRKKIITALKRGKPFKIIYRIKTRSGKQKWVWEQGVGILNSDGIMDSVEGFVTDITSYVNAERDLKSSKKLFQDLVMNSPVGISIVQKDSIVYFNPELKKLLGNKPDQFDLKKLDRIHPDDLGAANLFFDKIKQGQVSREEPHLRIMTLNDGEGIEHCKWVHCRAARIEYGGVKSILLIMLDITHAKDLERMVAIDDKMASLGRAAANIAHEIRNPLSGIYLYLSGMERKGFKRGFHGEIKESVDLIRDAATDIETVIKRILDFSRMGVPKFNIMDANVAARESLELSKVSIIRNNIQLQVNLDSKPLLCKADYNLLQRVILNLLSNAAEAMRNMTDEKRIVLSSGRKNKRIWISISDSGPGVPEETREFIFDPFYTTKSDGTGIGLSLCHKIIADHNGSISVGDSKIGGAEFVVMIPAHGGARG